MSEPVLDGYYWVRDKEQSYAWEPALVRNDYVAFIGQTMMWRSSDWKIGPKLVTPDGNQETPRR